MRAALLATIGVFNAMCGAQCCAQLCNGPATVPPSLEIEVLDPNADSNGTPAVELHKNPKTGEYLVDIPPVVLVHRYYYSGDRVFQGPALPGGPSIAVVNHPRSGERVYVPLQMMPGSPRVTYTNRSIDYDYGHSGVSIVFCELRCTPVAKYRSRPKAKTVVRETVQATAMPAAANRVAIAAKRVHEKCQTVASNGTAAARQLVGAAATPVIKIARSLPFAQWICNPNAEQATGAAAAKYRRDLQVRGASQDLYRSGGSIATLR